MRSAESLVLLALIALPLAACGARQAPPDDVLLEGGALLDAVSATAAPVFSARLRADADVYLTGGRVRVTEALLVDRPDRVRLETISPMRTTMSVLVARDGDLSFYDLDGGAFYVGDASAANIAAFAPIELGAADIVRLVLGELPVDALGAMTDQWDVSWSRRHGRYDVVVPAEGGAHYEIGILHDPFVPVHVSRHDGRRLTWSWDGRSMQTWTSSDATEHVAPSRMRFRIRRDDIDIELRIERFDVNPDLPPELFELAIPAGVRVFELPER